jgi:hypothetical protein
MKGIAFNDFLEMVESEYDVVRLDRIIQEADLSGYGIYMSVGSYNFDEMMRLVAALSVDTGNAGSDRLYAFGKHLFGTFLVRFPELIEGKSGALDFMLGLETIIHQEVRKLYPDAEPPLLKIG